MGPGMLPVNQVLGLRPMPHRMAKLVWGLVFLVSRGLSFKIAPRWRINKCKTGQQRGFIEAGAAMASELLPMRECCRAQLCKNKHNI